MYHESQLPCSIRRYLLQLSIHSVIALKQSHIHGWDLHPLHSIKQLKQQTLFGCNSLSFHTKPFERRHYCFLLHTNSVCQPVKDEIQSNPQANQGIPEADGKKDTHPTENSNVWLNFLSLTCIWFTPPLPNSSCAELWHEVHLHTHTSALKITTGTEVALKLNNLQNSVPADLPKFLCANLSLVQLPRGHHWIAFLRYQWSFTRKWKDWIQTKNLRKNYT